MSECVEAIRELGDELKAQNVQLLTALKEISATTKVANFHEQDIITRLDMIQRLVKQMSEPKPKKAATIATDTTTVKKLPYANAPLYLKGQYAIECARDKGEPTAITDALNKMTRGDDNTKLITYVQSHPDWKDRLAEKTKGTPAYQKELMTGCWALMEATEKEVVKSMREDFNKNAGNAGEELTPETPLKPAPKKKAPVIAPVEDATVKKPSKKATTPIKPKKKGAASTDTD